jgi:hypothetical protein
MSVKKRLISKKNTNTITKKLVELMLSSWLYTLYLFHGGTPSLRTLKLPFRFTNLPVFPELVLPKPVSLLAFKNGLNLLPIAILLRYFLIPKQAFPNTNVHIHSLPKRLHIQ